MRPLFHPSLVNGRYGDPTVYVETLFERRSLLFDIGEIFSLPPRKLRRIEQVFVSHEHVDHFVGFDHLLRLLVGHEKSVQLFGPSGFTERVFHKLQAYRWNLVESYPCDLVFAVSELGAANSRLSIRHSPFDIECFGRVPRTRECQPIRRTLYPSFASSPAMTSR